MLLVQVTAFDGPEQTGQVKRELSARRRYPFSRSWSIPANRSHAHLGWRVDGTGTAGTSAGRPGRVNVGRK